MRVATWPVLVGVMLSGPAWAQATHALVVRGTGSGWGTCPGGQVEEAELTAQGVPHTTVNPAGFATEDLYDYTMIFLPDCQNDVTYAAWNARVAELNQWVTDGGFLGVHATRDCVGAMIQPDIPGGTPTRVPEYSTNGTAQVVGHPVLAGVPATVAGPDIGFAWDSYTSTGSPSDTVLVTANDNGNAALFERQLGQGTIIYGGLTYSFYNLQCPDWAGAGDPGRVLANEVTWGSTFSLCGTDDDDGDGVGNDCDACPGFNDNLDGDQDTVPDDCDPCPNLPEPSDIDHDGICDNVDDSDDDGVNDLFDVCPGFDDTLDTDLDGLPDDCDNCPLSPVADQYDGDGDGFGLPCDCDDTDASVNPGADEYCNGVDDDCDGYTDEYTSVDARKFWVDADADGHGDVYSPSVDACEAPTGYVTRDGDCNDADVTINPDAAEKCDDIDQNCDGDPLIEGCPVEEVKSSGCDTAPSPVGGLGLVLAGLLAIRRRRTS